MKKKNIILMAALLGSLTLATENVYAASSAVGSTVGCKYGLGDINTQPLAEYVTSRLSSSLNFFNVYNTYSPTKNIITGETTNGRYFLESDVLYFAGHSDNVAMQWKGCTKNPVGIRRFHQDVVNEDNVYIVGVGRFNLSRVKFVMLEGCETAKGDANLAKYFVDKGASSSIGWTTTINTLSGKSWLTNFWDKISSGGTIKEANDYANSKSYMAGSIKNTKIYGNQNQRLNNLTYSAIKAPKKIINKSTLNNEYVFDEKEKSDLKLQLADIIKENINSEFNVSDFDYEVYNSNDYKIADFLYKVNGINVEIGYTAFIENGVITKIYDNTNKVNLKNLKEELEKISISNYETGNNKIVYDINSKEIYRLKENISINVDNTKQIDYIKEEL